MDFLDFQTLIIMIGEKPLENDVNFLIRYTYLNGSDFFSIRLTFRYSLNISDLCLF